jgi:DNA polymerase IV
LQANIVKRKVALVKFDRYIPESIAVGMLLGHTAGRFAVKSAPHLQAPLNVVPPSLLQDSQASLQAKQSKRQLAAEPSQQTDSAPIENIIPQLPAEDPASSEDEIVKDSFIVSSPPAHEEQPKSASSFDDALSEAILQTKAIAHLPIDEDEDEETGSRPSSSAGYGSEGGTDDEAQEPSPKRAKTSRSAYAPRHQGGVNQNAFQCMDPVGKSSSQNPNSRTIEILDQMCKYYDQMNDQWRTLAYRKAITTLRKQNTKVTTVKEAAALPFIGSRLAEKIEEIVLTNWLRRLDSTKNDPTDQVLRLFLGIYGAGLAQANKWLQAGHRSLDDLVTKAKLTDSQRIGIEHYHDFAQRIPRAEVEAHGNVVKEALKKLDSGFQATVMGSYRRGAKDSGDIDLIITKPGTSVATLREVVFQTLVPSLTKAGFLKVKLATSSQHEDGTKWHGVSCLPSSKIWRRLDLLLVPEDEMGAALIYFTGNDIFNRSIRLLASKKGMRLNQKGLYKDVVRGKNRERLNEGTLVEGKDEKRIFEILGVPWREPTERIC